MEGFLFYFKLYVIGLVPFAAILGSGLAFEVFFSRFFQASTTPEVKLARIVAFGLIWTLGCFGLALLAIRGGFAASPLWSFFYLIPSLGVLYPAWKWQQGPFVAVLNKRFLKVSMACILATFALQVVSVLWYPNVMDSPQLGWTNRFTDPLCILFGEMNGAVGYSGLIFFTGLLAPEMPLAVAASASKIVLHFLFVASVFYIARVFYGRNFRLGIILVAVVLFGSSLGFIQFVWGKDSLFAVAFTIFYLVSLGDSSLKDGFRTSAMFCGAAAFMGVISIPFLAVAAFFAFVLQPGWRGKLQMAASHFYFAAPLAAFGATAMVKIPFWPIAFGGPIFGFLLSVCSMFFKSESRRFPKFPFWGIWGIILFSYAIGFKKLPYRLDFKNFTSPFLSPLDGQTGFLGLIYQYNCSSGFITGFFLIGPFFATWLLRKANPLQWVLFVFLPVTLALFLWMCSSPLNFIDSPSQWTLIKNCIHYFLPIVAAVAVGPVIAQIPSDRGSLKGWFLLLALLSSSSFLESVAKYQSQTGVFYPPHRHGFIQSRNQDLALVADYLWKQNGRSRLLIDSATGFQPIGDFNYFAPRTDFTFWHANRLHAVASIDTIVTVLSENKEGPYPPGKFVLTTPEGIARIQKLEGIAVGRNLPLSDGRSFLYEINETGE